ncbi:hypothetical protein PLUTE_b1298 [Pseudoalteromonas luteoviolacea DSM 6061]|nr:hypothetical protein [Pseudoalteromonas luteoviolacea DSM 6061]
MENINKQPLHLNNKRLTRPGKPFYQIGKFPINIDKHFI